MEPIVLTKSDGGEVMVDPDDMMNVQSFRNLTVIVTSNYQVYGVTETPEEIGNMLGTKAAEVVEEGEE